MIGEAVLLVLVGFGGPDPLVGRRYTASRGVQSAAGDHPRRAGNPLPRPPGGQTGAGANRRPGHHRQDIRAAEAPIGQGQQRPHRAPVQHVADGPDGCAVVGDVRRLQLLVQQAGVRLGRAVQQGDAAQPDTVAGPVRHLADRRPHLLVGVAHADDRGRGRRRLDLSLASTVMPARAWAASTC